tara:strand:+ start:337 stop:549 length:213 start_codon:yes stop_codon:yes gene_type:complete
MSIGHTGIAPNGWGNSGKNRGSRFNKKDRKIFKLAQQLGFEATGLTKHQAKNAKLFLIKKAGEINELLND